MSIKLQPGDILLWRVGPEASWVDRLIGWGESMIHEKTPQKAQYYHVAFVSGDVTKMYSSQPLRIKLYSVPDPLPSWIEVYRLKGTIDPEGLGRVFAYADSRCGRFYDFLGVFTAGRIELGGLEFCSQLTEDAFFEYPIALSPDVRFSSPDDIAASTALTRVIE